MIIDFIKKLFKGSDKTNISTSREQSSKVPVPESVLDRFLINAPEIWYYKEDSLLFIKKGNEVKTDSHNPAIAGPSVMALIWLQDIAVKNRELYLSIVKKYGRDIDLPILGKKEYLWKYFKTGKSINEPQLTTFYQRANGIINFIDAMSAYCDVILSPGLSHQQLSLINQKIGKTINLKGLNSLDDKELAMIISRDYKEGFVKASPNELKGSGEQRPLNQHEDIDSDPITAYLLLFSADWCGPSRKFKQEIINGGVTSFSYIDVDKDESLSTRYNITSVPTTILIDAKGNIIKKWVGYDDDDPGQTQFIKFVKNGKYNIQLYPGCESYHATPSSDIPIKRTSAKEIDSVRVPAASLHKPINTSPIKNDVDASIAAFESGNISYLQNCLFNLVSQLNKPGSGVLITEYPEKDRLCECFSLCLRYDWMNDSDIREVWAENGFYCIIDYLANHVKSKEDLIAGTLDLFLHIQYSGEAIKPKVSEILRKARMRNEPVFNQVDYSNGADYLLQHIAYFAALPLKPIASQVFRGEMFAKYQTTINNSRFSPFTASDAFPKAQFIAKIIESILEDM